jgi:hypothetical protein
MMLIKASVLALGAVVALAIAIPQGFTGSAQAALRGCPVGAAGCPGGGTSSEPDGPGNPGGNGPDLPTPPPDEQKASMAEACNGALHELKKIPEKMVVAFDNEPGVSVVPVCNNGLGRQTKIDAAQALPLQNAIARNATLMGPLTAHGFKADDVVGVVLVQGVATLYVHKGL